MHHATYNFVLAVRNTEKMKNEITLVSSVQEKIFGHASEKTALFHVGSVIR